MVPKREERVSTRGAPDYGTWKGQRVWVRGIRANGAQQYGVVVHVAPCFPADEVSVVVRLDDGTIVPVLASQKEDRWDLAD